METKYYFVLLKSSGKLYLIRLMYLLTAVVLSPGGSITVHIYTQTVHRKAQITTEQHK